MNTTDNKNRAFIRDPRNPDVSERKNASNDDLFDAENLHDTDTNAEAMERGFTVRNGYNPNRPNPDQDSIAYEDDLDDLSDDFHSEKDLEDTDNDVYVVQLEDDDDLEDEDEYIDEDLDEDLENDEFDNPSDTFENDFNETEDVLEDIDDEDEIEEDDEEEDEDNQYIEDDVQEEEDYEDNDPRKF
ncbi:hypothetical protein [Flavobacterium gelatinilyticum]|uniref:hypothetical protein n=1 Tax=Flavobacterium gelatinilyticum TaxID=3003260 RepID=UPI0024811E57|nr:hypothetical protein [Flavobacterium gelatinilyticum]